MLCVVIKGPTFQEAHQQMIKALNYADLIELRMDYFTDLTFVKKLRSCFSIPMIFTLRSALQGGAYKQSEEKRISDLLSLAELQPEYLDVEYHLSSRTIAKIVSSYSKSKLILSYHNFTKTPEDIERIYQEMKVVPACFYKLALMSHNCLDTMRLLWWKKNKFDSSIITISMGMHGQISRILGPVVGIPIVYTILEEETSSLGQIPAQVLRERYHYHTLHAHSRIYGLIGDPVDRSISEYTHNNVIKDNHLDAVYVKIQVHASELRDFLFFAKKISFHGLSVTMPLKEQILPFLDQVEDEALAIGAVNTLLFKEGKFVGYNTDGVGALQVIKKKVHVKNKKIVIIGAGGAARAIAYIAKNEGAMVTIVNRNAEKASHLAKCFSCMSHSLEEMAICCEKGYDILINCTPLSLPISPDHILAQAIVFGYEMFFAQALRQFILWYGEKRTETLSFKFSFSIKEE